MSEYNELQVALINARDSYEQTRSEFPAAKDRRIHRAQCDLISNHIREIPELTAARDEAERLRARVEDAFCEGYKAAPAGLTKTNRVGMHVRVAAKDYAQRLRQQAEEAGKAGGCDAQV